MPVPAEHRIASDVDRHARSRIGQALGDKPVETWRVMPYGDGSYLAAFTHLVSSKPDSSATAWLRRLAIDHPDLVVDRGYRVVRSFEWPDYLTLTASGARFLNWGLLQLSASAFDEMMQLRQGGLIATQAMASVLFPEPT